MSLFFYYGLLLAAQIPTLFDIPIASCELTFRDGLQNHETVVRTVDVRDLSKNNPGYDPAKGVLYEVLPYYARLAAAMKVLDGAIDNVINSVPADLGQDATDKYFNSIFDAETEEILNGEVKLDVRGQKDPDILSPDALGLKEIRKATRDVIQLAATLLHHHGPDVCRNGEVLRVSEVNIRTEKGRSAKGGYAFEVHRDIITTDEPVTAFSMWMPIRTIASSPLLIADSRMFVDENMEVAPRETGGFDEEGRAIYIAGVKKSKKTPWMYYPEMKRGRCLMFEQSKMFHTAGDVVRLDTRTNLWGKDIPPAERRSIDVHLLCRPKK